MADPTSAFLLVMRHPLFWKFDFGHGKLGGSPNSGSPERSGRAVVSHGTGTGKGLHCPQPGGAGCLLIWLDVWGRTVLDLTQRASLDGAKLSPLSSSSSASPSSSANHWALRNRWAIVRFESLLLRPPREALAAAVAALDLGDNFMDRYPIDRVRWSHSPVTAEKGRGRRHLRHQHHDGNVQQGEKTHYIQHKRGRGGQVAIQSVRRALRHYPHRVGGRHEARGRKEGWGHQRRQRRLEYHDRSRTPYSASSPYVSSFISGSGGDGSDGGSSGTVVDVNARFAFRGLSMAVQNFWRARSIGGDAFTGPMEFDTYGSSGGVQRQQQEPHVRMVVAQRVGSCHALVALLRRCFGYNLTHFYEGSWGSREWQIRTNKTLRAICLFRHAFAWHVCSPAPVDSPYRSCNEPNRCTPPKRNRPNELLPAMP